MMPGFEIGLDLMATSVDYVGPPVGVDSLSLMLNARYAFPLGQATEAYVGAGLGAINIKHVNPGPDFDDTVAGGQIELGLRYNMAAAVCSPRSSIRERSNDATIGGISQSFDNTRP